MSKCRFKYCQDSRFVYPANPIAVLVSSNAIFVFPLARKPHNFSSYLFLPSLLSLFCSSANILISPFFFKDCTCVLAKTGSYWRSYLPLSYLHSYLLCACRNLDTIVGLWINILHAQTVIELCITIVHAYLHCERTDLVGCHHCGVIGITNVYSNVNHYVKMNKLFNVNLNIYLNAYILTIGVT